MHIFAQTTTKTAGNLPARTASVMTGFRSSEPFPSQNQVLSSADNDLRQHSFTAASPAPHDDDGIATWSPSRQHTDPVDREAQQREEHRRI
jgi:hypothetical protein